MPEKVGPYFPDSKKSELAHTPRLTVGSVALPLASSLQGEVFRFRPGRVTDRQPSSRPEVTIITFTFGDGRTVTRPFHENRGWYLAKDPATLSV